MQFPNLRTQAGNAPGRRDLLHKIRAIVTIFLIVIAVSSTSLLAQLDISASLSGAVTDPTGAVIPNAMVIVHNNETGVDAKAASDGRGAYNFPSLAAGTYTVTCAMNGFKSFTATDVVLHVRGTVTLPVVLEIGAATETVTVSGSTAMVDTETANNQITVDAKLIESVPVLGRDPRESLEVLMPGATAAGTGSSFFIPVTSFNGVSQLSNNYEIDGAAMNDYMHGSAATAFPQSENMSEFSVASALPDASVARGAGGQIESTLKNGTNEFHGQFWTYFQNGGWNANSWSNKFQGIARQPFSKRWYGGNIGGPVWFPKLYNGKKKTFFFTSYERTSSASKTTSTGETITDAERNGDFTNSVDGIPVINGVPTPVLDPSMFSTLGKLLNSSAGLAILPKPTSGTDTFTWNPADQDVLQTLAGRIDENFSDKHRLFGSLWWYNDNHTFDDMYGEFSNASWATHYPNPDATWGEPIKTQVWAINDTYTINPSMLNNFILGLTRTNISVTNTWAPGKELFGAQNTGIAGVGDTLAPDVQQISFPRCMGVCLWNGYINPMTQNTIDISDNFTLTKGRHTMRAGLEIRNYHEVLNQTYDSGATVSFSDSNTYLGGSGNGIADMLMSAAPTFYQGSTQNLDINYPAREAYVQDTFKFKPRLTFMLGARWQPHFGIEPVHNNFVTFRAGQQSTVFPTAPTGLVTIGDQGIPKNLYGVRWADIGPRASFAWDILGNHRVALKGGYGLYTDYQVALGFNGYSSTAPYGLSYSPDTTVGKFDLAHPYAQYGSVPFPYAPPVAGSPQDATLVFSRPVNTLAMDKNYNSGQIHKFNVTLETEPFNSYIVSVAWVATRGTHLNETHNLDWPRFVPGGSTQDNANVYSREPYYSTGFNTISLTAADYNSFYNALQIGVNKRFSYGLTFMSNYTYSNSTAQQGCRYEGNCGLDYYSPGTSQALSGGFRYELPTLMAKNALARRVFGGWALGGTFHANSGGYGSVGDYNCGEFDFSSASCNANYLGGGALLKNRKQVAVDSSGHMLGLTWLDPSKFVRADQTAANGVVSTLPGVGQKLFLGDATVGVWKGPANYNLNGSLDKDFLLVDNIKFNVHAEAFNAFNNTQLDGADYNNTVGPNTQGFGIISTAAAPRNVQLSLHLVF